MSPTCGSRTRSGTEPRPIDELAREAGANPDRLRRVLRALASDGMFAELEQGVFENTEASAVLARGDGWADFAHLFGGIWHRSVGALDATASAPAFQREFGDEFWTWLAKHPGERAAFDRAMVQNCRSAPSASPRSSGAATRPSSTSVAATAR